ncbi:MAG: carboxymuconolactone decarboxylase family protein [Sphingomonadaceae bacterium]
MSRIAKIDVAKWDPDLRALVKGDAMPAVTKSLFEIIAHCPQTAKAFVHMFAAIKAESTLSPRLLELMRLRIAFHNQCRTCMSIRYQDGLDDGVTEDLVCSLEKPMEATDLTVAERAALAFTDRFMNNHLSIDDSHFDALRAHFNETQLVELNLRLAMSGFGKMAAVLDMVEVLPEHFQDKSAERLTPWNAPHVVVA